MDTNETKGSSPKTLTQAIRYFATEERCIAYLARRRWPDGKVACPYCCSTDVLYLTNQRRWKCRHGKHARQQFSVKVGTIFEDSPLSLTKWLPAVWMIGNCKNGVSSLEIARDIGVTQKTAWFMLHRIRFAMQRGSFEKMGGGGPVEADETFIGGKARNMHKHKRAEKITGTGGKGKALVMGLLDRETRKVRVKHLADRTRATLHTEIKDHVTPGSEVFTDEFVSYTGLSKDFVHQFVNHAERYVEGNVHTNGLENFWSLLKRSLGGTYIAVEPFHLFRYLDEQAFRYNERKRSDGDAGRFDAILESVAGRRVTYSELTGAASAPTAATV